MKENQEKYNPSDFVRYHSGAMPPDEMHALEKAALDDSFLADALDGYAFSKNSEKELDEIRIQLNEKRKQKKAAPVLSLSSGSWWKIAAMFVVIAGAGYFFFLNNIHKENSLAIKEKAVITSRAKDDTSLTETNTTFEKPLAKENKANPAKLPVPTVKSIQAPPAKNTVRQGEIEREKKLSEEHIADRSEKTIIIDNDKTRSADISLTDSGEKAFSRSSDVAAISSASPNGNFKDKDTANAIAMNKTEPSLQDVVIVGYGKQRKKSVTGSASKKLEGKASGVEISSASPYPKGGKEKFDQYIKDNAVIPSGVNSGKFSADILLSFSLNKKGNPVDIKVLESSCQPCEAEAIRLLKEGPKWVGKVRAKGTARIRF